MTSKLFLGNKKKDMVHMMESFVFVTLIMYLIILIPITHVDVRMY